MTLLRYLAVLMLTALSVAAAQDGGQPAEGNGSDPATVIYELSQGGVQLGEVGIALERTEDGFRSESYVDLDGLVELSNVLVTGPDGAATSYQLSGEVQGVPVAMDGTFNEGGASFELMQAGQEATFELTSDEALYVVDNNFLDGFQIIAYVALERDGPLDVAAVVPQAGALGRVTADLRAGTEQVEARGRSVEARGIDIDLTVGAQTIAAVAWVDESGGIVALDQPLGNIRFTRVYGAAGGSAGPEGGGDALGGPGGNASDDVARQETAAEFLERTAVCVETRELSVESAGETLAGVLSLPVERPEAGVPTLLLLPGSGAVDMAGNSLPLLANSGYEQLGNALGCHGYGVLRAAKLGIPPSTGDANGATLQTYAQNVADWFAELAATDGVDPGRLGLIGHSEGGLVTLYAAAEGIVQPEAVVLLATAGRPLGVVLREQVEASAVRGGADQATVEAFVADLDELLEAVRASEGATLEATDELADNQVAPVFAAAAGLLRSEIDVDPLELAAAIDVPALVVQGLKDVQVLEVDGDLLAGALPDVLHLELPDLTHNLVETHQPAEAMLLPGRDAVISETLVTALATFLNGTLKLAR